MGNTTGEGLHLVPSGRAIVSSLETHWMPESDEIHIADKDFIWRFLGIKPTEEMRRMSCGSVHLNGDRIGTGGFADVYRTRWRHSDIAVKALKLTSSCLYRDHGDGRGAIENFLKELAALQRLDHGQPLIVQCYGVGMAIDRHEVRPAFFLELMECSLNSRFESSDDDFTFVKYLRDAAAGLASLHECRIIHRDVKPQNILLKGGRAKIADVGVARLLKDDENTVHASGIQGTPGFIPPEAMVAEYNGLRFMIGPDYDVFGLGVTILCCMTRRQPCVEAMYCEFVDEFGRPISELKRRSTDVDLLRPHDHPLLPLIGNCLDLDRHERKKMADVCYELEQFVHRMAHPGFVSNTLLVPTPTCMSCCLAKISSCMVSGIS